MAKENKPTSQAVEIFSDDRGIFVPFLNDVNALCTGYGTAIKRLYYVYNYGKGVARGFHLHQKEWKYFVIVSGAAKFVAINPKNPQEQFHLISSARKPNLITIPPSYANGWVSLEEGTVLVCASTASFDESVNDDKRLDPLKWGDVWSVKAR